MAESKYTFWCESQTGGVQVRTEKPGPDADANVFSAHLKGVAMIALRNARNLIAHCRCADCDRERHQLYAAIASLETLTGRAVVLRASGGPIKSPGSVN